MMPHNIWECYFQAQLNALAQGRGNEDFNIEGIYVNGLELVQSN